MTMIIKITLASAILGLTYIVAPAGGTFVMALLLGVTYCFIVLNRPLPESDSLAQTMHAEPEADRKGGSDLCQAA